MYGDTAEAAPKQRAATKERINKMMLERSA
jgi:hypothetical protein